MRLDPATLETVRHSLQLVRLAIFAGFILLGLRITIVAVERRRRAINALLVYVLLVQAALIVTQNEAWPFAMYPMMAVQATDRAAPHNGLSFRVVDDAGGEWPIDPLAWSPLYPQSVMGWFEVTYPRVSDADRRAALAFLLDRAEAARVRHLRGDRFYGNHAVLGPLAAPDTNLYGAAPPSPASLRALRVYRLVWNVEDFARSRKLLARTLICEYRR